MKCQRREEEIALYVEGDLPSEEAAVLARHLEMCCQCQQLFHRLQESQSILRSLAEEPMPAALLENLPRKVMNEVGPNPALGWRFRFPWDYSWRQILGFAGAMAAVVGGIWIGLTYVDHGAKEKHLARQSISTSGPATTKNDESISAPKPGNHAQPSREEKSLVHSRKIQRGRFDKPVQSASPRKINQGVSKSENRVTLAEIHKAMSLWQEMAANVEEREKELNRAKSEVVPDRLVAKLATQDPNIIIYWLEDAGRGKNNAIQN